MVTAAVRAEWPSTTSGTWPSRARRSSSGCAQVGDKLYLEFGGKLLFDYHASRVLPGFDPNVKMRLLQQLASQAEIILCIYAGDIERRKMRADFGITYDADTFKLIDDLREWGLEVRAVVITRFDGPARRRGVPQQARAPRRPGLHPPPDRGLPDGRRPDRQRRGLRRQPVHRDRRSRWWWSTRPGPTAARWPPACPRSTTSTGAGVRAGYAKFETFPIWNLPLRHPVNAAYEAATADLRDVNLIDPFHLEAYDERAVNYNRDVEAFPLLRRILERITGESMYQSPTDMGVNRAGFAIVDDEAAARRPSGRSSGATSATPASGPRPRGRRHGPTDRGPDGGVRARGPRTDRWCCRPARPPQRRRAQGRQRAPRACSAARRSQLPDGSHRHRPQLPADARRVGLVLNAIKQLAGDPEHLDLISPTVIESIGTLRKELLGPRVDQPQPGGDADRAEHQLDDQPDGPAGHGAAPRAPRLRAAPDPPADARRRAGTAPARRQPDLRPELRHQQAVRVVAVSIWQARGCLPSLRSAGRPVLQLIDECGVGLVVLETSPETLEHLQRLLDFADSGQTLGETETRTTGTAAVIDHRADRRSAERPRQRAVPPRRRCPVGARSGPASRGTRHPRDG